VLTGGVLVLPDDGRGTEGVRSEAAVRLVTAASLGLAQGGGERRMKAAVERRLRRAIQAAWGRGSVRDKGKKRGGVGALWGMGLGRGRVNGS
jgi:hypothetical protein